MWWSELKKWMGGMMLGVGESIEEKVRQKRAREQQFDWEYCCWLAQQKEQELEVESRYKKAQAWWVLASEETSSSVDFTACCTYVPKEGVWGATHN